MYKGKRVIITVCARKGSKGIKNKNIRLLLGKPLISYTLEQALDIPWVDTIIVSTDSKSILQIANTHGICSPFLRPKYLSEDNTPKIDVIRHAVFYASKRQNTPYDIVIDLDVTSPFRTKNDIESALNLFINTKSISLVSGYIAKKNPYFNMIEIDKNGYASISKSPRKMVYARQKAPDVYSLNGSIYMMLVDHIKNEKTFLTKKTIFYPMTSVSIDIDDRMDLKLAEWIMSEKKMHKSNHIDPISIGDKIIDTQMPTYIIAEAGVNHNGNLEHALKLVDAAKSSGADAVKFQTFLGPDVTIASAPMTKYQQLNTHTRGNQLKLLRKLSLPIDAFKKIKKKCKENDIEFLSTPHGGIRSVKNLEELDISAYKIGSGDLTNLPLLSYISKLDKPIILSTGMATMSEIEEAVEMIRKYGNNSIILLHCTSNYPCLKKDVHLQNIETVQKKFGLLVGYSDHTVDIDVPLYAVMMGACVLEKHITLNKSLPGPDQMNSLEPDTFKEMVNSIRRYETMNIDKQSEQKKDIPKIILGNKERKPNRKELEIAKLARKSLVWKTNLKAGKIISEMDIEIKRPSLGLHPREFWNILGRQLSKSVKKDTYISFTDLI